MKPTAALLVCALLTGSALGADDPAKPGTHRVSKGEVVLFTLKARPVERLALLFTNFSGPNATYKWMYFNPLTSDWVTGSSRLQEVYDKVPVGEGLQVTAVPGHNTKIQAGGISIEWSRGDKEGAWLYYQPEHLTLETLPGEQFYKLK